MQPLTWLDIEHQMYLLIQQYKVNKERQTM